MAGKNGFSVKSVTACIMAEKPKLMGHVPAIKEKIADLLRISEENVGISCKTLEGFGLIGNEEAIGCIARVLMQKKRKIYI